MTDPKQPTPKRTAEDAYVTAHLLAHEFLGRIDAGLHDLPAPALEGHPIHWGHVGEVNRVNALLAQVVALLGSQPAVPAAPTGKPPRAVAIRGTEHASAHDALVELNFSGDRAIAVGGRYFTVEQAEWERLQALGLQPTTFHHHEPTGRILSVPGRHG